MSKGIFNHAVKLLAMRDYTTAQLRRKLADRFGDVPESVIDELTARRFLSDRRYTENYLSRRKFRTHAVLREELAERGIASEIVDDALKDRDSPSLREALAAKMVAWNLRAPILPRDAARLFRALARLGYEEDAIREEIEQLHEQ